MSYSVSDFEKPCSEEKQALFGIIGSGFDVHQSNDLINQLLMKFHCKMPWRENKF